MCEAIIFLVTQGTERKLVREEYRFLTLNIKKHQSLGFDIDENT